MLGRWRRFSCKRLCSTVGAPAQLGTSYLINDSIVGYYIVRIEGLEALRSGISYLRSSGLF